MARWDLERRVERLERATIDAGRQVTVWARSAEEYAREVVRLRAAGVIRPRDEVEPSWGIFRGAPQDEVIVLSEFCLEDWLALRD